MSCSFDSYENFVRVAVDSVMNLILCNKLKINQKINGRINIAGAKIDDELCEDINVVLCSFLDTKQSIDIFDIEPNKENFNMLLTILCEYSSEFKTVAETVYEPKAISGEHIISRCRGM